jgi:hypothetical protein
LLIHCARRKHRFGHLSRRWRDDLLDKADQTTYDPKRAQPKVLCASIFVTSTFLANGRSVRRSGKEFAAISKHSTVHTGLSSLFHIA